MNYDSFLTRGLPGTRIWATMRTRCFTHNDMLAELRECQKRAAAFAKAGLQAAGEDEVLNALFLENMAWRVFWFGERSRFSVKPGVNGEYHKAMRQNYSYHADGGGKIGDYWTSRDSLMARYGEHGCGNQVEIFSLKPRRPCLNPRCRHRAVKEATKALKAYARRDWERAHLNRYRY